MQKPIGGGVHSCGTVRFRQFAVWLSLKGGGCLAVSVRISTLENRCLKGQGWQGGAVAFRATFYNPTGDKHASKVTKHAHR
jgi:hypothetical protein